ncbi:uncharacterized protein LOC131852738 [Achroia grisella]|uniref:uncharacterized protein LOC131852738 n=1 Tax=Achroia grisella TaxID=688607 RepID=UPI0027D20322|nr:uncharacterized protein LOC131852738 [Achroia grisella]
MTKRSGKKRKKKEEISDDTSDDINFLGSDSESAPEDVDKYKAFQIPDYVRFMRRIKGDDNTFTMQPTKTVSITFSCPVLPDTVDLNSWRFVVRPYIPPVKQCLKCLRNCSANINEAKCCHCNGNHIAISSQCPIKKKKIEENKNKVQSYADIVREKSFPQLGNGSKNESRTSFALYLPSIRTGHGTRIHKEFSIFSAESLAILNALCYIKDDRGNCKKWLIVTDSMSVLTALQSNKLHYKTNYIIDSIKQILYELSLECYDIILLWTPSHIGVFGNENADLLARTITNSDIGVVKDVAIPYSDILSIVYKSFRQKWIEQWQLSLKTKGNWFYSINKNIHSSPWFTKSRVYKNRKFYTLLIRLRFGHARFNSHLCRMKIIDSNACQECNNSSQTLNHIFFECSAYNIQRLVFIDNLLNIYKKPEKIPRDIQDMLTNFETYIPIYLYVTSISMKL